VVDLGYGLRLSPLPQVATLGRAARRGRAEALRAEAEAASRASAELTARQRDERAARGELEALQDHWEVWVHGDPRPDLERARAELAALLGAESGADRIGREQRLEIARLEARRDALRAQLQSHHLLDRPDVDAASVRTSLESAENAAAELARTASARKSLLAHIHDLEGPAPDAPAVLEWQRERTALDEQRHRLFAVAEALELVESNEAALAWSEAEAGLAERLALVPELESQHRRAEQELGLAQDALDAAEAAWERATETAQTSAAEHSALVAHAARARAEVAAQGMTNPDASTLQHARTELERCTQVCAELRRTESSAHAEVALCAERASEADRRARTAARELDLQREREPAAPHWQELADAAREVDAWTASATAATPDPEQHSSPDAHEPDTRPASAERWLAARAKCELLGDRLSRARGGAQLAESLQRALSPAVTPARGEELARFFTLWSDVKSWLARRLPAPLADLGEPLLGLARLEMDLAELERRLERQEGDLRGTSGDIARSIDVQLRRASTQLRRLNHSLDGVRFGSIHAIRVRMERAAKMERILAALRDGETQEILFQSNLPIEAALDEIFRRHAGGRTGGQRLLDFREYVELGVEIQRRPDQGWERVSASQVSTGEAIGIGAALMMVILTEWEKSDQLLRRPRENGSLRFLFLDEANRLSQDNLGVLFDLCQSLDLQLLIAAPEVARAEGNTTYRLVRRVSADGREEVLVTGRRSSLPGAPGWGTTGPTVDTREKAAPEPAAAEQVALFGE
jgi:chromosome partition protein MukB